MAVADEGLHAGIGLRALVGREKVWIGERCVGGVGDGKADAARAVSREPGFASQRPGQLAAVGVEPGAVERNVDEVLGLPAILSLTAQAETKLFI